jgi:hypothetical protein
MRKTGKDRFPNYPNIANTNLSPNSTKTVNISQLKQFIVDSFPIGSPLRIVFTEEDVVLTADAFLVKLPI